MSVARVLGAGVIMAVTLVAGGAVGPSGEMAGDRAAPRAAAASTALVAGTPCSAAARACADISSGRAWLIRNGAVEYGPVPIVSGRSGHPTPPGTFRVSFKSRHHVSSLYQATMPNAVFFNGNIAFHQGRLRGGSHGCVRLSGAASRVFFNSLQRGDVVQVVH